MTEIIEILENKIDSINKQIKLLSHALTQVSKLFKLDENRMNTLEEKINTLLDAMEIANKISEVDNDRIKILSKRLLIVEEENKQTEKEIKYLKTHTHNIFW